MIRFACPSCAATYTAADEKAGKTSTCPKCKTQFEIPRADGAPPLPSSSGGGPVEIDPCPKCGTKLTVEPRDLGIDVECPSCQKIFTARKPGTGTVPSYNAASRGEERPSRRPRNEEDDDRPRRSREDDDEDYDDRPRKRRRRRNYADHRGVLILVFGICSWVVCIGFGLASWIMGSNDLKQMDAGQMDPEGWQMTQIGRLLGMIHCILFAVVMVIVILFACIGALAGK